MNNTGGAVSRIISLLACPVCKGPLNFGPQEIACRNCNCAFQQVREGVINLVPPGSPIAEPRSESARRQMEMEAWYDDLLRDSATAAASLEHDYRPFSETFSALSGVILDLGGGAGLTRQFLRDDSGYVVLDPSLSWLDAKWSSIAVAFPCVRAPPTFIQGVGEHIPFADQSVDAVLACWSLNHVSDPSRVIGEIARVLHLNGRCILILEDMVPSYWDAAKWTLVAAGRGQLSLARRHASHLIPCVRRKWPLQSDHVRVTEAQIAAWASPRLKSLRRNWIGGYLTLELVKITF